MANFEERFQIRSDLLAGKIPKRIFVNPMFTLEAACGYAGVDLLKTHYDMELFGLNVEVKEKEIIETL